MGFWRSKRSVCLKSTRCWEAEKDLFPTRFRAFPHTFTSMAISGTQIGGTYHVDKWIILVNGDKNDDIVGLIMMVSLELLSGGFHVCLVSQWCGNERWLNLISPSWKSHGRSLWYRKHPTRDGPSMQIGVYRLSTHRIYVYIHIYRDT